MLGKKSFPFWSLTVDSDTESSVLTFQLEPEPRVSNHHFLICKMGFLATTLYLLYKDFLGSH